MKDSRTWIIAVLALLVVGLIWHESQPKRPFLRWLGSAIKTAFWVAPFVLDEPPAPPTVQSTPPNFAYGAPPERAIGADGYEVIDHGANW